MLGYIVRRLVSSILVIVVASVLVFAMVSATGDPLAELRMNPNTPAHVIEARRQELNLDEPVHQRYVLWLQDFVTGDFGETNRGELEVRPILFRRLQVTLRMVLIAMFVAVVLAVAAGVLSAVRQYSVSDYTVTFFGFLFLSTPVFWLAALLKEFGAIRINDFLQDTLGFDTRPIATTGDQTPNLSGDIFNRLSDYAGHLVLPTIALAAISFAAWSRFQRASMLDVLNSDYVRLARAKGLSNRRVLVRHALRNALIPLTTVVAIDFGAIIGGAIITESVFNWQGMGDLLLDGLSSFDPNVVLAWLMVTSIVVVIFNLIADLLYGVLDPRIRYG
jgi:peptide/nickel transport system permease protein